MWYFVEMPIAVLERLPSALIQLGIHTPDHAYAAAPATRSVRMQYLYETAQPESHENGCSREMDSPGQQMRRSAVNALELIDGSGARGRTRSYGCDSEARDRRPTSQ